MTRRSEPSTRLGPRIAAVLRYGTLVAVAVAAAGWIIALTSGTDGPGGRPIGELIAGGGGDAIASVGLLALTLLPFGVLLAAAATFHADGERRYLLACLATLLLLAGSLVVSALVVAPS